MTSSTALQSTLALRSINAFIAMAPRSSGRIEASAPPYRPNGVLIASHTKASGMILLPYVLSAGACHGHAKGNTGQALQLFQREPFRHLDDAQAFRRHIEDSEIGVDAVHASNPGYRIRALGNDLGFTVL